MPSLLGILVSGCALIVATSTIQALGEEINNASLRSLDGAKVRQVREARNPSCIISITEDEAYRLTRLLNGFINCLSKWILTLAFETMSSTVRPLQNLDNTVAPLPEKATPAAPSTALQVYLSSGLVGLIGKPLNIENKLYKGEFLYLARNPTHRSASVWLDAATLVVGEDKLRESAFQWEFVRVPGEDSSVVYLRNKLNELKPIPSKEDLNGSWNYIRIETVSSPTVGESSQLVITMKETVKNEYYYHPHSRPNTDSALNGREIWRDSSPTRPGTKWIVTLASETLVPTTDPPPKNNSIGVPPPEEPSTTAQPNLETLSSTVATPPELSSTVAPQTEEPFTVAPPTALQAYLSSGLAGLTGKPLNIENEHYKGEFLYLASNPTDRSASFHHDVATLAVGGDKLRESAFQWEFVRVPGEDSSVVYLRNKLNELKSIPSKEDLNGRWNYIWIETVSSGTVGEASQLVITMKEILDNKYYYYPHPTPNRSSELNGRGIWRNPSPSHPGTKWIVTLAS